ncbi:Spy/CpxP family protein refolding chaperone [Hyunsoonleella rubra]|uniref:Spy/CpxP family protein refolding chaperone n=1 Tax=Hyunsoonleella rubra TaxID=1737062 RepID=A0ABW5TDC3_9FLAO
MKKNLPLYILLLFLIVVNGFFLYNYLGSGENENEQEERRPPGAFLMKELDFDEGQKEAFRALTREHRQKMRGISDDIRELKDLFFSGLSDEAVSINRDSVASLIGDLEARKDMETYLHFKQVQELCDDNQKAKFSKIIKDALHKGAMRQGPPRNGRPNGDRPPLPEHRDGNRPPPARHQ